MKCQSNKKRWLFIEICLVAILIISGCQKTPQNEEIISKGESLSEAINKTAVTSNVKLESSWRLEKKYKSEKKLTVNAKIVNNKNQGISVLSVKEKEFKNEAEIKKIVTAFFPGHVLYDTSGQFTKEQINELIIAYKKYLTEETDPDTIKYYENEVKKLEKEYPSAMEEAALPKTDYKLKKVAEDGSEQLNIVGVNKGNRVDINFINWKYMKGSSLFVETISHEYKVSDEILGSFLDPEDFKNAEGFREEKRKAEQMLKDAGIDYLRLYTVSKYKDGYEFYFTRATSGMQESFLNRFLSAAQSEKDVYMDLWKPEYFKIRMVNGTINKILWENPSEVVNVENKNVQIISFDEARERFEKQMDYWLTLDVENKSIAELEVFFAPGTEIVVNKVELGLTKLLMKNTNTYMLIPTWNFMGYEILDEKYAPPTNEKTKVGSEICFAAINALDGSIVNLKAMY